MRRVTIALTVVCFGGSAWAQSLGEVSEREKKKKKPPGGRVYTNEDLEKDKPASPSPPAKPSPAPQGARGGARPPESPEASDTSSAQAQAEAYWRARAQAQRDVIRVAEAKVAEIQARIDALRTDLAPTNVMDPFRLQSLEAERRKATEELEHARSELTQTRKGLEDLEEEARRKGVPPGWLRER